MLILFRCILCVRSTYFAAMLSGSWMESESQEIKLEGYDIFDIHLVCTIVSKALI